MFMCLLSVGSGLKRADSIQDTQVRAYVRTSNFGNIYKNIFICGWGIFRRVLGDSGENSSTNSYIISLKGQRALQKKIIKNLCLTLWLKCDNQQDTNWGFGLAVVIKQKQGIGFKSLKLLLGIEDLHPQCQVNTGLINNTLSIWDSSIDWPIP